MSAMYSWPMRHRGLGHLADRAAAVGPVRVHVQVARAARRGTRRRRRPAAPARRRPARASARYSGTSPLCAWTTTAAVLGPTPLRSLSVFVRILQVELVVVQAVDDGGGGAEGLHPVAGLAGALQEEGDPPERGRGRQRVRSCSRLSGLEPSWPASRPSSAPWRRASGPSRSSSRSTAAALRGGPAGAVADRRLALGVDGGEQQPAEQAGVLQEVAGLPEPLLRVVVLPEAVPGQRRRHDGRRRARARTAGGACPARTARRRRP